MTEYAFPRDSRISAEFSHDGMTLRDYFAAQVIGHLMFSDDYSIDEAVNASFLAADAMLKERSK